MLLTLESASTLGTVVKRIPIRVLNLEMVLVQQRRCPLRLILCLRAPSVMTISAMKLQGPIKCIEDRLILLR